MYNIRKATDICPVLFIMLKMTNDSPREKCRPQYKELLKSTIQVKQLKEPSLTYVKVKHKATKRNFPKEEDNKEVKEKQAKTSNGTATLKENTNITISNNGQNGHSSLHDNDIAMDDNEEVRWIQEMTREKEEAARKVEEQKKMEKKVEEERKKVAESKIQAKPAYKMTQQEKWLEMQRQKEEEKKKAEKPNVSQANQLENIAEAFERKRQRRMAAR